MAYFVIVETARVLEVVGIVSSGFRKCLRVSMQRISPRTCFKIIATAQRARSGDDVAVAIDAAAAASESEATERRTDTPTAGVLRARYVLNVWNVPTGCQHAIAMSATMFARKTIEICKFLN